MRRMILILITCIMIFGMASCSDAKDNKENNEIKSSKTNVIGPSGENNKSELTILIEEGTYNGLFRFLKDYLKTFEDNYGVKINFDVIEMSKGVSVKIGNVTYSYLDDKSRDDFQNKLASKMYLKDGPELIFYLGNYYETLVNQGAIMDATGKIPNLDNVYDSLLDEKTYYIPIAMNYNSKTLNKNIMKELGIADPGLNWSKSDFDAIKNKWIQNAKPLLTRGTYNNLVSEKLDSICTEAEKNKMISLDNEDIKEFIRNTRDEVFSGKYEIDPHYKFQNLYNMMFELQSDEFRRNIEIENTEEYRSKLIDATNANCNLLRAEAVTEAIEMDTAIVLPGFSDQTVYVGSYGFLVNRNGKNINLALELIDVLLSDEMQMKLYDDKYSWYPVNKNLEADITEIENGLKVNDRAKLLKQRALDDLKQKNSKLSVILHNTSKIKASLNKDLTKLILADTPLKGDELGRELQNMENKYNIWLNE